MKQLLHLLLIQHLLRSLAGIGRAQGSAVRPEVWWAISDRCITAHE